LLLLLRQDAAQTGPPVAWRAGGGKPEGWRARCAPVRCAHMDVRSANPAARSRTRRAGCPESAPPGVCFFGYFLCTSKESDPLARRASGSFALPKAGSTWIPAFAGMTPGKSQNHPHPLPLKGRAKATARSSSAAPFVLLHVNRDLLRHDRRVELHVRGVGEIELQGVVAGFEVDRVLGLALAVMLVRRIVGNRRVEGR
jgi:hypothetical protein